MIKILIKAIVISAMAFSFSANAQQDSDSLLIINYLSTGGLGIDKPAFHAEKNVKGKKYTDKDLLNQDYFDISELSPQAGDEIHFGDIHTKWEKAGVIRNGYVLRGKSHGNKGSYINYMLARFTANSFMKLKLKVESHHMFQVYLDGKLIKSKNSAQNEDKKPGTIIKELDITRGTYQLIFKSLYDEATGSKELLRASFKFDSEKDRKNLTAATSDASLLCIEDILCGKRIESIKPSFDGQYYLASYSETECKEGKKSAYQEIRRTSDHKVLSVFRNSSSRNYGWSPASNKLAYTTRSGDKSILWIYSLEDLSTTKAGVINKFASYEWSPDETYFIVSVNEKAETREDVDRLENMNDRQPWWRTRRFLYQLYPESGHLRRLTWGHLSTHLADISPDGKSLIFNMSQPDFTDRPYRITWTCLLNLENMKVDTIWEKRYSGKLEFSPDGNSLLCTGAPGMFGEIGINLPEGKIPNNYDAQAFIYNIKTQEATAITRGFHPAIIDTWWLEGGEKLLLWAITGSGRSLYSFDIASKKYTPIKTGEGVITGVWPSANRKQLGLLISEIQHPAKSYLLNTNDLLLTEVDNPAGPEFDKIQFGEIADHNFKNKDGVEIEGWVYYPPGFDPSKKYPLIVYYYAGTSPSVRVFGGRYPKNLFAAQDYVVYVLNPGGATGYGQEFSAEHVNNWGITVADEIIEGTKGFIEANEFIDKERLGCIGASYGGFMTMLLTTRTDIFAAAVAHAGISSLSSYWGEGYWGYSYSSTASANSFPWNNRALYIDQSPLFNADKVTTPLLLVHGKDDTNVPPGESIQMYTALKLLGKEVEYIEVKGQNHHILNHKKRIKWQNSILAWFDKWLKSEAGWWDSIYPDKSL